MRKLTNILSVIALLLVGCLVFVFYASSSDNEVPYLYQRDTFSNKNYAPEMKPYSRFCEDRTIKVFDRPNLKAHVIGTIYNDSVFQAVRLDCLPQDNLLSQVEDADRWFMLLDEKSFVCINNIVEEEAAGKKSGKKKKTVLSYDYSSIKFTNERNAFGKFLTLFARPNANYIFMSIIMLLVLVDFLLNRSIIGWGKYDEKQAELSIPVSFIANILIIFYFIFMLPKIRTGYILWYINPWEIGWWVILTAILVSGALMGNSILTLARVMENGISDIISDKSEKWPQKIFSVFVILVYILIGGIGGIISFVFGLLGAVLVYTVASAPKILLQETAKAFDPEAMFRDASKPSAPTPSYSEPSSANDAPTDFSPDWDATTHDENGNERKLRSVGVNQFEDDLGRNWKQTGCDTVERDD